MDSLNKGSLAPKFSLLDIEGNKVQLDEFTGKKVYVTFWASWCAACLTGLEEIDNLARENNDFEVLTIVSPRHEGEMKKEDFISWFGSLGYEHIPVLFDENGLWSKEYNVLAYPSSYYIGTDGILVKSLVGHQTNDDIKTDMESIY